MIDFNYRNIFDIDCEKWTELDIFLSDLSTKYQEEFAKEIYKDGTFMLVGYKSNPTDIGYSFDDNVSSIIKELILEKLKLLFPNNS